MQSNTMKTWDIGYKNNLKKTSAHSIFNYCFFFFFVSEIYNISWALIIFKLMNAQAYEF